MIQFCNQIHYGSINKDVIKFPYAEMLLLSDITLHNKSILRPYPCSLTTKDQRTIVCQNIIFTIFK
jgi:hypothetical protein